MFDTDRDLRWRTRIGEHISYYPLEGSPQFISAPLDDVTWAVLFPTWMDSELFPKRDSYWWLSSWQFAAIFRLRKRLFYAVMTCNELLKGDGSAGSSVGVPTFYDLLEKFMFMYRRISSSSYGPSSRRGCQNRGKKFTAIRGTAIFQQEFPDLSIVHSRETFLVSFTIVVGEFCKCTQHACFGCFHW